MADTKTEDDSGEKALSHEVPGRQLACGWNHTIVLGYDGTFYGWGTGEYGELGADDGFVKFPAKKLDIPKLDEQQFGQVCAGAHHTVIVTKEGKLYTMGMQKNGRLGHNGAAGYVTLPEGEKGISYIAAGSDHTLAIGQNSKNCYAFGLGQYGNLGDGSREDRDRPVRFHIIDPEFRVKKSVRQVSCGSRHSLALCDDGQVYSWGYGMNGRLGLGDQQDRLEPTIVRSLLLGEDQLPMQICAGDSHSLCLTREGRVYAWGSGSYGRLGLGMESDQFYPKMVEKLKKVNVLYIHAGSFHNVAIADPSSKTSTLWVWGGGKYGKLGLRNEDNQLVPRELPYFKKPSRRVRYAACGLHHTVVVTEEAVVYAFGYAQNARCGVLTDVTFFSKPRKIGFFREVGNLVGRAAERETGTKHALSKPKARQVQAGYGFSAVLADDKVYTFGANEYGQLGTGFHRESYKPMMVRVDFVEHRPPGRVIGIATGAHHCLAVLENGSVFAWGRNDEGQLGLGDTKNRAHPELVQTLQGSFIVKVVCGLQHCAAIAKIRTADAGKKSAQAYVWGSNKEGQLGLGPDKKYATLPATLRLPNDMRYDELEVALGAWHSLVIASNYLKEESHLRIMQMRKTCADLGTSLNTQKNDGLRLRSLHCSHLYTAGNNASGQLGRKIPADEEKDTYFGLVTEWGSAYIPPSQAEVTENRDEEKEHKRTRRPLVKLAAAGASGSLAVLLQGKVEDIYGFGMIRGIERSSLPKKLVDFEPKQLQSNVGLGDEITAVHFDHLSMGENHYAAVCRYSQDSGAEVSAVFMWGETRMGKLGVGNVSKFAAEKVEREEANRKKNASIFDDDDTGGGQKDMNVRFLSPAFIKYFARKNVDQVECSAGDHTLAVSSRNGTVYAWGFNGAGRLGMTDEDAAVRSEVAPKVHPFFEHAQAAEGAVEEEDEDEDNEEEQQAEAGTEEVKLVEKAEDMESDDDEENPDKAKNRDDDLDEPDAANAPQLQHNLQPQERFAIMAHSQQLLATKQDEYVAIMNDYLKALDQRTQTAEIVELAIDRRILQSLGLQFMLRSDRNQAFLLRRDRGDRVDKAVERLRVEKKMIEDDRIAQLPKSTRMNKRTMETLEKRAEEQLEKEKRKLEASIPSQIESTVSFNNRGLDKLEQLVARYYMAPCLLLDMYKGLSASLKENELEDSAAKAVVKDFIGIVYSVYDLLKPQDHRLFVQFLEGMVNHHLHETLTFEELFALDSLEWLLIEQLFQTPKYRKISRDIMFKPIFELKRSHPDLVTSSNSLLITNAQTPVPFKAEMVVNTLNLSSYLISDLLRNVLPQIMLHFDWLIKLLEKAFYRQRRNDGGLIGRRILNALSVVGQQDQSRRHEYMKRLFPTALVEDHFMSPKMENAVLIAMRGADQMFDYLLETTGINARDMAPKFIPLRWTQFMTHADPRNEFNSFVNYLSVHQNRIVGLSADRSMQLLTDDMEVERLLLYDHLLMRSRTERRIVQISPGARELFRSGNYLEPTPEELVIGWASPDACPNVRLDVFHTDLDKPSTRCTTCGAFHPDYNSLLSAKKEDEKLDGGPEVGAGNEDIKSQYRLTAQNCADIWRVLKEKEFGEIVQKQAGETAWESIMETIAVKRAICVEKKQTDLVDQYEQCARHLRQLRVPGTAVFLEDKPVTNEIHDPSRLFETLRLIDDGSEMKQKKAVRNVNLMLDLITAIKREQRIVLRDDEELKYSFNYMTLAAQDVLLERFKNDAQTSSKGLVQSELRHWDKIHVVKERGKVQQFRYYQLVGEKVLEFIKDAEEYRAIEEGRVSNKKTPDSSSSWWMSCFCPCLTDQDSKNFATFFSNLRFLFVTTDSDDIFELKVVYRSQLLKFQRLSIAMLDAAYSSPKKGDENDDLPEMASTEDTTKMDRAKALGVPDKCHIITYDPRGDNVPVYDELVFKFDPINLISLLKKMPRPLTNESGTGVAVVRGQQFFDVLAVDAAE